MIEGRLSLSSATIGVLTVLPEEFTAACEVLGCDQEVSADGRIYRIGTVRRRDNQGEHIVVVCRLLDMGNNAAAARTVQLNQDCPNVREVIMCGIAGAVPNPAKPSDHVRVGDIVITNGGGVVQYDFVRESERQTEMQPKWFVPSRRLLEAARLLEADEKRDKRPWNRHIDQAISELGMKQLGKRWKRPPAQADCLREFDGSRLLDYLIRLARAARVPAKWVPYRPIVHPYHQDRIEGVPRVFHGVIASANNLQKNPARRDELRTRFRAMAIEMEGSGVADAAYHLDKCFFVVRGTCDYCNADKNDDWHHYAAIVAAAYTKALLEAAPLLPYLAEQEDAPVTAPARSGGFQNVIAAHACGRTADARLLTNVVEDVVQRDLEHALGGVLEDQGRRRITAIKQALDAWEFHNAFALGDGLSAWVEQYSDKLSKELVREIYEQLVRVEIVRATREAGEGAPPDLSRADYFLAKAKNVSGH